MDNNTALQTIEEPATQTKRCSRCGQEKPLGEFYKVNPQTDRLSSQCRECSRMGIAEFRAGIKRCTVCGEVKPRDDFYRYSRTDKMSSVCKSCMITARREVGSQTKTCCVCKARKPLYDFYRNARQADKHDERCKICAYGRIGGMLPEDTAGEYVEPQIASIIRELAALECGLDERELQVGKLRAKQVVLKDELTRICMILRTTADPVERRCDYGRIKYDDTGLSVTLEPEVAELHRGEY